MNTQSLLLEGEEIKYIKGTPDYYISNYGRAFTTRATRRWGKSFRILRHRDHPTGYKYIGIYIDTPSGEVERKWLRVHRVVAEAFIGPIKRNMVVDHIDENKGNNRADNLQILTHSQNKIKSVRYRKDNGL